jgi:hypothetical protein
LGGVKVDGTTITITDGVISGSSTYTLPTASAETLGGVKVGTRLTITDGVLSADVQSTDISGKQDTLVSGTNIKTINDTSLLGSGNITITGGGLPTMYTLTEAFTSTSDTLADVTPLAFNCTEGKSYRVEIIGKYRSTAATSTGCKMGFYLPSGAGTIVGQLDGSISSAAVATGLRLTVNTISTSGATGTTLITSGTANTSFDQHIGGIMIFTCTTTGVFQVQYASEVNNSASVLAAGTTMLVTQLN